MTDMEDAARAAKLNVARAYSRSVAPLDAREAVLGAFPDARFLVPVFVGTGLADGAAGTVDQ